MRENEKRREREREREIEVIPNLCRYDDRVRLLLEREREPFNDSK